MGVVRNELAITARQTHALLRVSATFASERALSYKPQKSSAEAGRELALRRRLPCFGAALFEQFSLDEFAILAAIEDRDFLTKCLLKLIGRQRFSIPKNAW